jgi:hypothetical protein
MKMRIEASLAVCKRVMCALAGHRGSPVGVTWTPTSQTVRRFKLSRARFVWKVCERCGELYGEAQK